MVKTYDELFEMWLDGEIVSGETRRDFCEKQDIDVVDMKWAFIGGASFSAFNRLTNDDKGD